MADEARQRKVQDRIHQTVARMLGRRIKDPRLSFVTITDVRVTGDLQHASIFYTVLGDDGDRAGAGRAFESAKGIIRSEVGKALGIRLTPTLEFILDGLPESAAALEDALAAAKKRDAEIAASSIGATYAGDADPYRRDEEDEGGEEADGFDENDQDLA
ncbi:30S ribosome-binding factor RbfA [Schaalia turicensis]|uniref:30S ribosome-binding factor RbfA n=1 Tax=Schaalia turicensis TaxID=131111 RepID=UPI001897E483|nr:30S ribosome-binding factor RbfA [Schaalia turicensis]